MFDNISGATGQARKATMPIVLTTGAHVVLVVSLMLVPYVSSTDELPQLPAMMTFVPPPPLPPPTPPAAAAATAGRCAPTNAKADAVGDALSTSRARPGAGAVGHHIRADRRGH